LRAIDTAGLRETLDPVEQIGVGRSRQQLAAADLVLLVLDASAGLTPDDRAILGELDGKQTILVANKCDLGDRLGALPELPAVRRVATRGEGIEALEEAIAGCLVGDAGADGVWVSNIRHRARLEAAVAALASARDAAATGFELDVVTIDVKIAAEAL